MDSHRRGSTLHQQLFLDNLVVNQTDDTKKTYSLQLEIDGLLEAYERAKLRLDKLKINNLLGKD